MSALARSTLGVTGFALAAAAIGAGAAIKPQLTFVALVALLGVSALAAPASAWVLSALVAAMTFKGLASLGVLPSVATFMDLPLAWGALFVALLKQRERSPLTRRHLRWLAVLGRHSACLAFNRSEILRPLAYLALLGEPLRSSEARPADPPSPRMRLALERTLLVLVLIQIPLVALEWAKFGSQDPIQGTLYHAGAGAHVISAVIVVGAIWILGGGIGRRALGAWRLPVVAVLFFIPFLADAKQVIVALPVILLASSWRVGRLQFVLRGALVVGAVIALFTLASAHDTATRYVQENAAGHGGKQATALFLWRTLSSDPAAVIFGKGPAETVSRAAFMTLPGYANSAAPFEVLGLRPAVIPLEAQSVATAALGGGIPNSTESSVSSLLGVFGDLGVFGSLAYAGLLLSLFIRLRRETSPEGIAAACGFALFMVLGVIFDWWEQPPLGVFLGVLAGLSLSLARSDKKVLSG